MKKINYIIAFLVAAVSFSTIVLGQSGQAYRRVAVMNGNQVRTVFGNWGAIGVPAQDGKRGAWKNDNNGYIGDVSPLVGAEVNSNGTRFHTVVTTPIGERGGRKDVDPVTGKYWALEPVSGYFNANQQKVAITSDPRSWPPFWPDKLNDPNDPGWRINPDPALSQYSAWNGYFGKKISADLETYFVMDDNNDEKFNKGTNNAFGIAFQPDASKPERNGLALEVKVRAMQWNDPLAKDNIFWLYEITNQGTTDYDKVVFGMLVGTYVGVTSTEDYKEYDDDWSFYDVFNNLTYTGDYKPGGGASRNPLWVGRVGMVGYAFLESPGNPYDGIDNDADADSSIIGRTTPLFTESMFTDSTVISVGTRVVIVNNDFSRSDYMVPDVDSVIIPTRGNTTWVYPRAGTKVIEGNSIADTSINANAYDGVDNNYNGLIDENHNLHFRAIKRTTDNPPIVLLDVPHVLHYTDYSNGQGLNGSSMIDEKRDDGIDNNGDWNPATDDVGGDGVLNTGDQGEGDGAITAGEPHFDRTDVRESDQLGLTSFFYFAPSSKDMDNDEDLWKSLAPGLFAVPTTIQNNEPVGGEDGDFIYGSGYFPLLAKTTERFSLALVYGGGYGGQWPDDDIADLLKNKKVVQQIYDANYQFPLPPDKPTLTAVAGDKKVTLYWNRRAEESVDPVLQIKDFEGYKIYKSTDPNFSDIYSITDAYGIPIQYKPLVQFDLNNGIEGLFRAPDDLYQQASGLSFDLGKNTGLQHSFVDNDVQNGRRYYYAVVAYDRGDEVIGLYPKENTNKVFTVLPNGTIEHDINAVYVTPNAKSAGYVAPQDTATILTKRSGFSNGILSYQIVDPTKLTGHQYEVSFFDTKNDSLDNNKNNIKDFADSTEWTRITVFYNVKDKTTFTEPFIANDTALIPLQRKNLDPATVLVNDEQGNVIPSSNYVLDVLRGTIRGIMPGALPSGKYTMQYQYYPIWRSANMKNSPYAEETQDADIFDGLQLVFENYWTTALDEINSTWLNTPRQYSFNFHAQPLLNNQLYLYRKPSEYEIQFSSSVVDSSVAHPDWVGILDQLPAKFRIYNTTDSSFVKFYYSSSGTTGDIRKNDQIVFLELEENGRYVPSWTLFVADSNLTVTDGSKLLIKTLKPFTSQDQFEFTTELPKSEVRVAQQNPLRVRVVPNPYITASEFEPPLNPGIVSGRGTRKIDFIHLPAAATVKIFTSRGEHVVTLHHDGNIENGAVSWNLKTKENLDIAFGIYFYVVESLAGNQTGKIAIIK